MNSRIRNTTQCTSTTPDPLNHAISLFSSGRRHEALAVVTGMLIRAPGNLQALNIAGICAHSLGRLKDAEDYWRRALKENPDDVDVNSNLGILLKEMKRFAESEAVLRRALAIRPDHAEAHANLGNLLHEARRFPEAEAAYRQALHIRPEHAKTQNNLGVVLHKAKRFPEAEAAYRRAVAIQPDYADAHANLGNLLYEARRFSESEAAYRRALQIRPDHARAYGNLGMLLYHTKRLPDAEAAYRQALAIQPDDPDALYNLGYLLYDTKRFSEAEAAWRQALSIRPTDVETRMNLGVLMLHTGRFSEGWPLYEARNEKRNSTVQRGLDCRQWRGESLQDRSIAVHCEQGFGDVIQFVRYLPRLKTMGASHITLICSPPLRALLEGIDGADAVRVAYQGSDLPDYWTFLLSLPLHLRTTLDSIPASIPYLEPSPDRLNVWKRRIPASGLRIGLVWKGSAEHANDRNRSLPGLSTLAPLWRIPGIQFVSLQKGQGEDEAASPPLDQPLINLGTNIEDFADSAAIVAQLDLVICVDTAIGHVAGALGKPCWILLPRTGTDWRWLEERTDSPWYPGTTRLFRQRDPDDWAPTIEEVTEALRDFAKAAV